MLKAVKTGTVIRFLMNGTTRYLKASKGRMYPPEVVTTLEEATLFDDYTGEFNRALTYINYPTRGVSVRSISAISADEAPELVHIQISTEITELEVKKA